MDYRSNLFANWSHMDDAFPDNWTYLRTELNWLDRVLAGAVARQRQDTKAINQIAKTRADQVTSHWWKGLVQLEGAIAGDSPADLPRRSPTTKLSYQQRLDQRIAASQRQGIVLGLPALCQQLDLSAFEKNVVLMALAPEVSRRYGRIYNFLQDTDHPGAAGLPTIDLVLRLLCRNDNEWRVARLALSSQAKLCRSGIVVLPTSTTEPFLAHPIKLADAIAEFLLADTPHLDDLDFILSHPGLDNPHHPPAEPDDDLPLLDHPLLLPPIAPSPLPTWDTDTPLTVTTPPHGSADTARVTQLDPPPDPLWERLILPETLKTSLQHWSDRGRDTALAAWGFEPSSPAGTIVLLIGATGTGKTLVARAIAQSWQVPLAIVDLARLEVGDQEPLLQQILTDAPPILLIKAAHRWLGRSPIIPPPRLSAWWRDRQTQPGLTLFSSTPTHPHSAHWHAQLDLTVTLPFPNPAARQRLWQQAFPAAAPLAPDIDWQALARWKLSGGAITAIAREAAIVAFRTHSPTIGMAAIEQAHQFYPFTRND